MAARRRTTLEPIDGDSSPPQTPRITDAEQPDNNEQSQERVRLDRLDTTRQGDNEQREGFNPFDVWDTIRDYIELTPREDELFDSDGNYRHDYLDRYQDRLIDTLEDQFWWVPGGWEPVGTYDQLFGDSRATPGLLNGFRQPFIPPPPPAPPSAPSIPPDRCLRSGLKLSYVQVWKTQYHLETYRLNPGTEAEQTISLLLSELSGGSSGFSRIFLPDTVHGHLYRPDRLLDEFPNPSSPPSQCPPSCESGDCFLSNTEQIPLEPGEIGYKRVTNIFVSVAHAGYTNPGTYVIESAFDTDVVYPTGKQVEPSRVTPYLDGIYVATVDLLSIVLRESVDYEPIYQVPRLPDPEPPPPPPEPCCMSCCNNSSCCSCNDIRRMLEVMKTSLLEQLNPPLPGSFEVTNHENTSVEYSYAGNGVTALNQAFQAQTNAIKFLSQSLITLLNEDQVISLRQTDPSGSVRSEEIVRPRIKAIAEALAKLDFYSDLRSIGVANLLNAEGELTLGWTNFAGQYVAQTISDKRIPLLLRGIALQNQLADQRQLDRDKPIRRIFNILGGSSWFSDPNDETPSQTIDPRGTIALLQSSYEQNSTTTVGNAIEYLVSMIAAMGSDSLTVRRIYNLLGGNIWFSDADDDSPEFTFRPAALLEQIRTGLASNPDATVNSVVSYVARLVAVGGGDTRKLRRIYEILGGDAWFSDANDETPEIRLNPENVVKTSRDSIYNADQANGVDVSAHNVLGLLAAMTGVVYGKSGFDRYPARVPADLSDPESGTKTINDAASWHEWGILQLDALMGAYPIKIKYKDGEGTEQEIKLDNLAETLAESVGLLLSISSDTDILQSMVFKAIVESVGARTSAITASDYAQANAEFLGYRSKESTRNLKITITPGADNLKASLRESTQKIPKFQLDDKTDLLEYINRLLVGVELVKAAFFRPYSEGDNLPGEGIRDDRDQDGQNDDQQWSEFITTLENPPSNERDPQDPYPNIRTIQADTDTP